MSEAWPKLGTTEFTAHITKTISAKPDLLFFSVWGGDYIAFYKQALRYDLFKKMKVATTLAFGVAPHALGKDHPEGIVAGVHANYHFLYPPGNRWPLNAVFVKKFHDRWKEYPNFEAEGAYTALHMLKIAIEKANRLIGGWPDEDAIIAMLEGLSWESPAGYVHIRADNHQGYKDAITGIPPEHAGLSVPGPRPEARHRGADPQHHGAPGLPEGRADDDLQVDRGDLAAGDRLSLDPGTPGPGGWRFAPAGAPSRRQDPRAERAERPPRHEIPSAPCPGGRRGARRSLAGAAVARAGHEFPFYPSYYPQEITVARRAAGRRRPPSWRTASRSRVRGRRPVPRGARRRPA